MNLMQVDLLRRWRATAREDEDLFQALLASVSGIAQGLQTRVERRSECRPCTADI